jgi:tetratricopeptide (TPR) repeat protein
VNNRQTKTEQIWKQEEYDGVIPALPDLYQPTDYANWRDHCLYELKIPREILVHLLEENGTPIALVRAAFLLHVHKPSVARAKQLAEQALLTGERLVYLLAKTVLAHITANEGFAEESQSNALSHATKRVLQGVLIEVAQLEPRTPLHLEIEVRAHLSLSEACAVLNEEDEVLNHASEVVYLAPRVGLASIGWVALYQIADVHFRRGQMSKSQETFDEVLSFAPTNSPLHSWALIYQSLTNFWLGDEDNALALFAALEGDTKSEYQWLPELTLRHFKPVNPEITNTTHNGLALALLQLFQAIRLSKEIDPSNVLAIETFYGDAAQAIAKLAHVFETGWFSVFGSVVEAIVLTRSGRLRDAAGKFPDVNELETLPPAAKALAYAGLIEIGVKRRDLGIEQALEGLNGINATLQQMNMTTMYQVAKKLELIAPLGLAMASQWSELPIPIFRIGAELIMSFRERRAIVFGQEGLEPRFAAELTLSAFLHSDVSPVDGGRQLRAMRNVLCRRYHDAEYWYCPISPAEIIASFLLLEPRVGEVARHSASEVFRRFKIVPRLRESDENKALDYLEEVLLEGLGSGLDVTRFKQFLQIKGESL